MKLNKEMGEIICPKCNGTGDQTNFKDDLPNYGYLFPCTKCQGSGKLDWIETVVGKEESSGIIDTGLTNSYTTGVGFTLESKIEEILDGKVEQKVKELVINKLQEYVDKQFTEYIWD